MKVLTLKLLLLSLTLGGGSVTSYAVKPHPTASFGDPLRVEISNTLRDITNAMRGRGSKRLGIAPAMQVAVMARELNKLLLLSEQFYDLTVAHRDYAKARLRLSLEEDKEQVGVNELKQSAQHYSEWAIEVFKALVEIETSLTPEHHTSWRGALQQINANAQHLLHNPYLKVAPIANSWQQFFIERHVTAYAQGELETNARAALAALATTVADEEMSWDARLEQVLEQTSTFIISSEQLRRFNNIKAEREPQAGHPQHYQQYAEQMLAELQHIETTLLATDGMRATHQLLQETLQEARIAVTGEQRDQPLRSFSQLLTDLENTHKNFMEMVRIKNPLSGLISISHNVMEE